MATDINSTKDAASVLNGLIETNKDGDEGYRLAAEKAKDPSLKSLFSKYAVQRASNATELQTLVSQLGEQPATSGHVTATIHRGWINLKSSLSSDEDKALIFECEAGEDSAMKNYKEALATNLPTNVSTVIQRQFTGVQEAHNVIRDMKHSLQAAANA